jgi:hypothetical protein
MRPAPLPFPGSAAPEAPEPIDIDRIAKLIGKTTPEEDRLWERLPELFRAGLKQGFSPGLEFAMNFEVEAKRRHEGFLTADERRTAKEARLSEIFQSVLG